MRNIVGSVENVELEIPGFGTQFVIQFLPDSVLFEAVINRHGDFCAPYIRAVDATWHH